MKIEEFENDEYRKIVYLGQWKQFKVWQFLYTRESLINQGRCRYILNNGARSRYARTKEIVSISEKFINMLSRIALHYSQNYSYITYVGKWNGYIVWEVWNLETKEDYKSLPKFVLFNGRHYKMVEDSDKTLEILNNFL